MRMLLATTPEYNIPIVASHLNLTDPNQFQPNFFPSRGNTKATSSGLVLAPKGS